MNKSYGIHDKWTDLDKVNNIEIQSVDGVIEEITVNGEPAGGGGDFTTAYVTINTNNQATKQYIVPYITSSGDIENLIAAQGHINAGETQTITAVLGRGGCSFFCQGPIYSVSGNAQMTSSTSVLITGDCTITVQ